MKTRSCVSGGLRLGLFFAALLPALVLQSAPLKNSQAAPGVTNALPAQIPESVFVNPSSPAEGRDPFFPKSIRPYNGQPKPTPVTQAVELVLNGLSGAADHKLAMINGHTFAEGEKAEVSTGNGRVLIQCIQITDDSVVIEIAGARRELKLRRGL